MRKPNILSQLFEAVALGGAKKATYYMSPTATFKATYQGKRDKRSKRHTVLFSYGNPNYAEREFIRLAKKAKEPFPIKKVQLKWASS